MDAKVLLAARRLARLSQADAAARAGTAQSALSAYENGTKVPTPEVLTRILSALGFRPSILVESNRDQIIALAEQHHATNVRVFGSIARGQDKSTSDIDLLVHFAPGSSLFDLVALADDLEALLGVHVDVVSDGGLLPHHEDIVRDAVPV
jgi:predicted nucleotidyltransferase